MRSVLLGTCNSRLLISYIGISINATPWLRISPVPLRRGGVLDERTGQRNAEWGLRLWEGKMSKPQPRGRLKAASVALLLFAEVGYAADAPETFKCSARGGPEWRE